MYLYSGKEFAFQADSSKYNGISYEELDCQAFVEKVLSDLGVRNSKCKSYNWKGSNDMWRNALSWKGTYQEALTTFGAIPEGAWLFTVKDDGGEKERGYNDNEKNASHVGIYISGKKARHSTAGGVQYCECPANRWSHVGLCKYLDYSGKMVDYKSRIRAIVDKFAKEMETILNES